MGGVDQRLAARALLVGFDLPHQRRRRRDRAGRGRLPHPVGDGRRSTPALDPLGALLSIAGLGALVYGIIEAPDHGWLSSADAGRRSASRSVVLGRVRRRGSCGPPSRCSTCASSATRGSPRRRRAITLVFFAMFGIVSSSSRSTCSSCSATARSRPGVRMLPWALAYMISAPQSASSSSGSASASWCRPGSRSSPAASRCSSLSGLHANYSVLALVARRHRSGHGHGHRAVDRRDHRSLPLHKAGVGSAVNDTTRELGGALGVAVMGSLVASLYRGDLPASAHAGHLARWAQDCNRRPRFPARPARTWRMPARCGVRACVRHHAARRGGRRPPGFGARFVRPATDVDRGGRRARRPRGGSGGGVMSSVDAPSLPDRVSNCNWGGSPSPRRIRSASRSFTCSTRPTARWRAANSVCR